MRDRERNPMSPSPCPRQFGGAQPIALIGAAVLVAAAGFMIWRSTQSGTGGLEDPVVEQEAAEAPWFEEVATAAGLSFHHSSGFDGKEYWLPEIVSGGVGLLDFDGDGLLDVYLVQSASLTTGKPTRGGNVLFRNKGDGSFEDVTTKAGVGDEGVGMGCTCGDYDGDGHVDIYVTNVGPNVLYRNRGDGTFENVTQKAGVGEPGLGASAAFADYDRDGDLDLFLVNYVDWSKSVELTCYAPHGPQDYCQPNNYQLPAQDHLFRNSGDGTFENVSVAVGLNKKFGNGLGVTCSDINGDGRMDFFVANDSNPNQLWIQDEQGNFQDESLWAGVAVNLHGDAEAGMGVATIDIDHDGDQDLFLSHLRGESNTLYRNDGGTFEDASDVLGISSASLPYTGFGLGFADFDHDGHLDVFVANGDVLKPENGPAGDAYAQPNQLLTSVEGKGFREVLPAGGTQPPIVATSRGAGFGDLDNDGDIDIVVVNRDSKVSLLRNVSGSRGNWIQARVLNANGSYALHARVRFDFGGRSVWRTVDRAYSYCSSCDPRVHVGLGAATQVDRITVFWPDGTQSESGPHAGGEIHEIRAAQ